MIYTAESRVYVMCCLYGALLGTEVDSENSRIYVKKKSVVTSIPK